MPDRFILDCDPGHDDAVAILTAARFLNLVAVTTVFGNSTVENTTRNALAILEAAELDIPVYAGEHEPLAGERHSGEGIHGKSGLDGANFPAPRRTAQAPDAVSYLIETVRSDPGLHIIAVAPLTNIARAIERAPDIVDGIKEISIMGGSTTFGNATAAAEFNIYADPEAAQIVFAADVPRRMVGLNVTTTFGVDADDLSELSNANRMVARELSGALDYYLSRQSAIYGRAYAPMHDVCAVLPYSHPELLQHRDMHVAVECAGELTRGQTVCDQRGIGPGQGLEEASPTNTAVAVHADGAAIVHLIKRCLLEYP